MHEIRQKYFPAWLGFSFLVVSAGAVVLSLNMGLRQTFGLFLEPMTLELGISRADYSLAIAFQNILWGLLTPLVGGLADRYGTARLVFLGGVIYCLGILVTALGDGLWSVHLGAGFLIGIAVSACGYPLILSAVARHVSEKRRSFAMAFAATGGSVGQFLLLPLSQYMIAESGWRPALILLAALAVLIMLLAVIFRGRAVEPGGGETGSVMGAVDFARRHRGFLLLNGGFFVCGFHVAFIATHLPGYITANGHSAYLGATALSVIGFFNIVGGLATGPLGARYRKKNLLTLIYLARAVVIGFLLTAPESEIVVLIFSASFGLLWLSTVPLTSGLVGDIFGTRYLATLFGIVMCCHQLGAFCGAWLGGLSYDLTGSYQAVWFIAILLALLAALAHWPIADQRVEIAQGAR